MVKQALMLLTQVLYPYIYVIFQNTPVSNIIELDPINNVVLQHTMGQELLTTWHHHL